MADLKDLTIPVKVDDSQLKQLEQTAKKTASEIGRAGDRGTSTFNQFNKEMERSALKLGLIAGLVGGFASQFAILAGNAVRTIVSLPGNLINALIDAGKVFEAQATRIGAAFGLSEVQAKRALEAIRAKAALLPIPINESVEAIEQLETIDLGGTGQNLEIVASAALSTGKNIQFIANALKDMRPESLRDLGIELKRVKDTALITFNGMTVSVDNTTEAIRKGLLDAIAVKFPDGIKRASSTLEGALTITRNLISNLISGPGSDLSKFLARIVDRLNDWLSKNSELITQDIRTFVVGIETSVKNLSSVLDILTGDFGDASGAIKVFGSVILAANESVLLLVKGIAAIKATQLSALQLERFNPFDPKSLIFADELDKKIKQAQTDFNNVKQIVKDIEEQNTRLARGILFPDSVKREMDAARESAQGLLADEKELANVQGILNRVLNEGGNAAGNFGGGIGGAGEKLSAAKSAIDSLNDSIIKQNESLIEQIRLTGLEGEARIKVESAILREKGVKEDLIQINEKLKLTQLEINKRLDEFQKIVDDLPLIEFTRHLGEAENALSNIASIKFVSTGVFGLSVPWIELKETVKDTVEETKDQVDSLGNYIGSVMSNISSTMADALTAALTGGFDDIKRSWKDMLKSLLNSFLQFVTSIALNPIRIGLEAILGIGGGGKTAGAGAGGGANSLIGTGAGILGSSGSLFGPSGSFTALGALFSGNSTVGFGATLAGALPAIGLIIGAALTAVSVILPLLKKTPRLDIDFDSVKTETGRRAALVAEFLDEDFFKDAIAQISVKRKAGLGLGGDEKIKQIIQDRIEETIETVQSIINKLPSDLASFLNEQLLQMAVDTETVIKGERLLEFDAKGKKIKEKFEAFINGELQAKFLFAIRDFFVGAFESLGVLPDKAQTFIDAEFEKFKKAGSREARTQIGQELLASFNAFVDAFNIVSGNVNDAIGQTIQNINALSSDLGFEAVPSIAELREELGRLIENAEIDPDVVKSFIDLRAAIIQLRTAILDSISSIIGNIQSLNSTIASFGGSVADVSGFINTAIGNIQNILSQGGLSLDEQEFLLGQLTGFANQLLAEEKAAFEAAQAAQEKAAEAQRAAIQARIDGLQREKDRINEAFRIRIDALNEELRIAQDFQQLTESIGNTLDSILFSPESVLTGVEQVSALQARIGTLQSQLAAAGTPELQLKLSEELRDAFKTLFDTAGDAFGVNSPEFVAIFDQVTGGLKNLADLTETRGRSVEEISAEIERLTALNNDQLKAIDAKIQAAQDRLASIGQQTASNTFKASAELQGLFEFIRSEYIRILEERFEQLGQISEGGFATELEGLIAIADVGESQLTVMRSSESHLANIANMLSNLQTTGGSVSAALPNNISVPEFQHGSDGFQDFGKGTLAMLHGIEAVVRPQDLTRGSSEPEERIITIRGGMEITLHGDSPGTVQVISAKLTRDLAKEIATQIAPGVTDLRRAVQSANGRR